MLEIELASYPNRTSLQLIVNLSVMVNLTYNESLSANCGLTDENESPEVPGRGERAQQSTPLAQQQFERRATKSRQDGTLACSVEPCSKSETARIVSTPSGAATCSE